MYIQHPAPITPAGQRSQPSATCSTSFINPGLRETSTDPSISVHWPQLVPDVSREVAHPGVRHRLERKQRTSLSSRVAMGISWSPLSGQKGVKPPLEFGERTRDCTPGHAGKEKYEKSSGHLRLKKNTFSVREEYPKTKFKKYLDWSSWIFYFYNLEN